jgi:hypothetical protein
MATKTEEPEAQQSVRNGASLEASSVEPSESHQSIEVAVLKEVWLPATLLLRGATVSVSEGWFMCVSVNMCGGHCVLIHRSTCMNARMSYTCGWHMYLCVLLCVHVYVFACVYACDVTCLDVYSIYICEV